MCRTATPPNPQSDFEGSWEICSPNTVENFSAVGYYFARELWQTLQIPIGLISSNWGGTPAEAWTPLKTLESDPAYSEIVADSHEAARTLKKQLNLAEEVGEPILNADAGKPSGELDDRMKDMGAFLWNGMMAPLKPAAFRGVIWYQGESNASRAEQYRTLFPDMIEAWRDEWGRGDFPFYFVQLANFSGPEGWPELREAQSMALELPETGIAVSIDIGDPDDIHPKNKQDVGRRLALWALAKTYGQTEPRSLLGRLPVIGEHFQKPIPHSGPLFEKARFQDEQVRLSFNHVYDGLETRDGNALRGFTIAGGDGVFREADAEIDGEAIIASHPKIDRPTAVRYAWDINPDANLVNSAGLPASPFRVARESAQPLP